MLDELTSSSILLRAAIERYSDACLAIQRSYARGEKPHLITPQLPLRMDAEVEIATSLDFELRKATAAIKWSRNHSSTSVAINNLPSELLAHIFHLVHCIQPCAKRDYNTGNARTEPIYPAVLSLVCSRWREIAFSTPTIWSHIDVSTSTLLNRQRLSDLMKLHMSQAGEFPPHILSTFFKSCTPGKLTRLTLMAEDGDPLFITGNDNPDGGYQVGLSTERLEDVLSHVSTLRLAKLYPQWSSRAYHGLVELRLTGMAASIAESKLTAMLQSSPDLRIFQFALTINDPLPANSQIAPIPLKNLEVLNLAKMDCTQIGPLLRWLAPGSKPLHLAVTHEYRPAQLGLQLMGQNSISFFSRACITRAYGRRLKFSHIMDLLDLSPNLQVLALKGTRFNELGWRIVKLIPERQLECLYMADCSVEMVAIRILINYPRLTIRTFSFYRCRFFLGNTPIPNDQEASQIEELTRNHPGVRFIIQDAGEPNPIESWELFPSYKTL
ncbi:hypothetical protein RSAG8_02964, partial [Rhizoctonia solani AG-8 WAC10335]